MSILFGIINNAVPLLCATLGGLISEYTGAMALFLEGAINLSSFFFFMFTVLTKNAVLGFTLSIVLISAITLLLSLIVYKTKSNVFLASLAMNIFYSGLQSFLSSIFFNSRGVLYSPYFKFVPSTARTITTIICLTASILFILWLKYTTSGIKFRITGSDWNFLNAQGIHSDYYKIGGWVLAALMAGITGCSLSARLSSCVPGIAAGKGWTALAAVFLGRKNPLLILVAVIVFAVSDLASTYIQNITIFQNIPTGILLSFPYLIALLMIVVSPAKSKE